MTVQDQFPSPAGFRELEKDDRNIVVYDRTNLEKTGQLMNIANGTATITLYVPCPGYPPIPALDLMVDMVWWITRIDKV